MDELKHRSGWQIILSWLLRLDWLIILLLLMLMTGSLFVLNSASHQADTLIRQSIRFAAGFGLFFIILLLPGEQIRRITPPLYVLTVVLLALVLVVGVSVGGSQRWLDIGVARIQPSELAKLAVPMMVAWVCTRQARPPNLFVVINALIIVALPTVLIQQEPDLGTALLVGASGIIALFLAGLSWWLIGVGVLALAAAAPLFWFYGIKPYQRQRVLTLFNPEADPLGSGYHIIQSKIAIGSGGMFGKGYMQGTQSQLAFLPESSTDFIFSVIAEEKGLIGVSVLLGVYSLLILRGLYLSTRLSDRYARILSASVFFTFFVNIFVNIGMVSGFLPVVGLPLVLISYGGSSVLSLMAAFGLALNLIGNYKTRRKQEHL